MSALPAFRSSTGPSHGMPGKVQGVVEFVTYWRPESSFCIAKVRVDDPIHADEIDQVVTVKGAFPQPEAGVTYVFDGTWKDDPKWGLQLDAASVEVVRPSTVRGVERYLASGPFPNIGASRARAMVEKWGAGAVEVLDRPDAVALLDEIQGITPQRARDIVAEWQAHKAQAAQLVAIYKYGLTPWQVGKIIGRYGDRAVEILENDPYDIMGQIPRFGFLTVDGIAGRVGIPRDDVRRARAAVVHLLEEASGEGHCFLPVAELTNRDAQKTVDLSESRLREGLQSLLERSTLLVVEGEGDGARVYLRTLWEAERQVAGYLRDLAAPRVQAELPGVQAEPEILQPSSHLAAMLTSEQSQAVEFGQRHRLVVVTGGPGTGKCVVAGTLVLCDQGLVPIEQLAPTATTPGAWYAIAGLRVPTVDGWAQATGFYDGGVKSILRMRTARGFEVRGTHEHPVWCATSEGLTWKRLDQLRPGDFVGVHVHRDSGEIANAITAEQAYLAGALVADGTLTGPAVVVTKTCVPWLEKLGRMARRALGADPVVDHPSARTAQLRLRGGSHVFKGLRSLGLDLVTAPYKTVPASILKSSAGVRACFVQGLFDGDAHVDTRGGIEWTTASERLAHEVQVVLASLGVWSSLRQKPVTYNGESRTYWRLAISGVDVETFAAEVGLTFPGKAERLAVAAAAGRTRNTNVDVAPAPGSLIRRVFESDGCKHSRREWWAWKREISEQRNPSRTRVRALLESRPASDAATALAAYIAPGVRWDVVESVASLPPEQVYDLTVPGPASFVANGLYVHNTFTLQSMLDVWRRSGLRVELAAPTGKAAQRMSDSTGEPARTIHRLLEWKPEGFARNELYPIDYAEVIVIDETSMVDIELARSLLAAIDPTKTRLVFVGDVDQLPSVGPGQVLHDIIASGICPVVRLTKIMRQEAGSAIIRTAHSVNAGRWPDDLDNDRDDLKWYGYGKDADPEQVAGGLLSLVCDTLPAAGYDPIRDVQVLCPQKRGPVGTANLNDELQRRLNAQDPTKAEVTVGHRKRKGAATDDEGGRVLRVGDKVIQTSNNYRLGVFNGEVGFILAASNSPKRAIVDFGDPSDPDPTHRREVEYNAEALYDLHLGYALTVHKSQGSEFPVVIIPVHTTHYMMLRRRLLYTGITRARETCVLLGTERALRRAVSCNEEAQRHTRLAELLRAETKG